jgi:D-sedoheptulose 7-phosphate isomerase
MLDQPEKGTTASREGSVVRYLERSGEVLHQAATTFADDRVHNAIQLIADSLRRGRPLLICGNGGSAADAQHITGELVGRFLKERRALNAICLSANVSVLTAWANDYDYDEIFARQVEAHGVSGGVLLAITTSGNSPNVIKAAQTARHLGLPVVALTGRGGGTLASHCDVLLDVPSSETPLIQQVHICLYHFICEQVETLLA